MRHRGQGQPWGFRSQKAPRRLLPPPPSLPPPPPQPPPPPPRRPPPCADGRVRSRRGGASHRGRRHTAQHGPGNQAPLGGKLTGERAGREDHRAFQTVSDTRPGAALAPRAPLRPVAGHRQSGDARLAPALWAGGCCAATEEAGALGAAGSSLCAPPRSPARPAEARSARRAGAVRTRQPRLVWCGTRSSGRSPKIRAAADASAVCAAGRSGLPGARRRLDGLPVSRSSRRRERERQGAADAFPRRAGDRAVFTIDPSPRNSLVK